MNIAALISAHPEVVDLIWILYVIPSVGMLLWNVILLLRWRKGISFREYMDADWIRCNGYITGDVYLPTRRDVAYLLAGAFIPGFNALLFYLGGWSVLEITLALCFPNVR